MEGWGQAGEGIFGISVSGTGVHGTSTTGPGTTGDSPYNYGVAGGSQTFAGVRGTSASATGTEGWSTTGVGVAGMSAQNDGVWGLAQANGRGVFGSSLHGIGVHGKGGHLAGFFEGDVEVTGDIRLTNADCAEDIDVVDASQIAPGTVMVLGLEGALSESTEPYDRRVAGVVSGAGNYRPGITLDKQEPSHNRLPIGLLGKVYCKVDAQYGAISIGDLLTTSGTPGHAMKAADPAKAFGSVLGKALRSLESGRGMVPRLITLQ